MSPEKPGKPRGSRSPSVEPPQEPGPTPGEPGPPVESGRATDQAGDAHEEPTRPPGRTGQAKPQRSREDSPQPATARSSSPRKRFESYPERLVREAIERGDFNHNPYIGKPVDLGRPGGEKPWIVSRLEQEDLRGVLPPALQLRRAKEDIQQTLREVRSESQARQIIEALNDQIRAFDALPSEGPRIVISLLDVGAVLADWRAGRGGGESA